MMNWVRRLAVLTAVLGLCGVGAASASAAEFTYSATGELEGHALETQVFTVNGGNLTCTKAATTGLINKTNFTQQAVSVSYSGCTAFGFASVDVSGADFLLTANGT